MDNPHTSSCSVSDVVVSQKNGFQNGSLLESTLQEDSGMHQLCAETFVFLCRPFQRAVRVPLSTEQMTPSRQNKSHTIFDDLLLSKSTLHKAYNDLLTMRSAIFCVGRPYKVVDITK